MHLRDRWDPPLCFLAAATAAGLAYYANDQLRTALRASFSAQANAVRQANLVLNNQSLYLAQQSRGEAGRGNLNTSLLLALEALPKNFTTPERPLVHQAITALAHATFLARRIKRIQAHREAILSVAASMDEKWLLSGAADGTLTVRSLESSSFGEELVKTNPGATILAVETSADGTISAALSTDGRIRIWNTSDWVKPKVVEINGRPTWMGIDPTARYVAATNADGFVVLLRSADGERDGVLAGHTGVVTSGSFDQSGLRLVTASDDGTIRIWDVPTKTLIHSIPIGNSEVWDVQFSATGDLIATASADGAIRLWNPLTATLVRELHGHKHDALQVIISPRSDRVLSKSGDGDVILWNVSDGGQIAEVRGVGGTHAIAFNRDGTLFVAGGADGELRVFDASSGLLRASLVAHPGAVMTVAFAPRSDRIISAGDDGQIVIWDLLDRPSVRIQREDGLGLVAVLGQSGESIVTGSWDGVIETRKSVDGSLVSTFQGGKSPAAFVTFPACANGPVSASLDNIVRIWDSEKLAHAQEFSTEVPVNRIILDSTCRTMVVVLNGGRIEIRNFKTNSLVHVLGGNSDNVTAVDLSIDAAYLASGYTDGMLRLWDLTTGKLVAEIKGHSDEIAGLGFNKENLLFSASWDGALKSWNVPDLKSSASADVVGEAVASFIMTDDRSHLVTGGWDGRVTVWSLSPLLRLRQWQAHKAAVSSLAYDEKSKLILTSGRDRTISLWDFANGELLTTMSVSADAVTHSEFGPDASQILINVGGTELQLWRGIGTLTGLVAEAKQHLVRPDLSDSERARFSVTNREPTVRTPE
jgi:WD40 repeat protein